VRPTESTPEILNLRTLKELGALLVKDAGLHSGLYDISFQLNWTVGTLGPSPEAALPGALIGIKGAGLTRADKMGAYTVDASEVNPSPAAAAEAMSAPAKRPKKSK